MSDERLFVYTVDAADELTSVSDRWLDFARENDAPELTRQRVLKRSLFDFVCDLETQHIYEVLFERVRATGSRVRIPFRCDSPQERRYMELEIVPLEDYALELRGRLLRSELRAHIRLLQPTARGSGQVLSICGWCKRVKVSGEFLEVEEAIDRLNMFGELELPPISHVTCPDCHEHAMSVLRAGQQSPPG